MDDENGVSRMSRLFEVTMNLMRAVSSFVVVFFCADVIGRADKPTEVAFLRSPNAPVRVHIRAKKKLKENNKTRTPRTNTIIALRVFCSFVCSFFRWIRSSFFFSWRQMKEKDLRCFLFFFPYRPFLIHTEILCPVFICFFLFFLALASDRLLRWTRAPRAKPNNRRRRRKTKKSK